MRINIISGFLGAGKTTLLNKLLPEWGENTVVIENEFGQVSIDSQRIKGQVPVREIYAGCICCSLAADFQQALKELAEDGKVRQAIIEPSGVGKLSDVVGACREAERETDTRISMGLRITVVDMSAFEEDREQFGDFYLDQIKNADAILFSHLEEVEENRREQILQTVRELSTTAGIYSESWLQKNGKELMNFLTSQDPEQGEQSCFHGELPDEHSFSSVCLRDVCFPSAVDLENWIGSWAVGKWGEILRAKGTVRTGASLTEIDYTPHHCKLSPAEEGGETDSLVIMGYHLKEEELKDSMKGGKSNG